MKSTLIILGFFLPWVCFADELQVSSNTPSGTYSQSLEVYLHTNTPEAKIVYYTDGIGRMNQLLEYTNNEPIIITKDTTLDFFAVLGENSTKVQEVVLNFNYQNHFILSSTSNEITLKNTSSETQNIGFWRIEGEDYKKTFPENTFIEAHTSLSFPILSKETFTLSSPDGSINIKSKNQSLSTKAQDVSITSNRKESKDEEMEYVDFLPSEEENIEYIDFSPSQDLPPILATNSDTLINSTKASILENSKHSYNLMWGFVFLIMVMCVGIFEIINVTSEKQFQKKLSSKERLKKAFRNINFSNFGK